MARDAGPSARGLISATVGRMDQAGDSGASQAATGGISEQVEAWVELGSGNRRRPRCLDLGPTRALVQPPAAEPRYKKASAQTGVAVSSPGPCACQKPSVRPAGLSEKRKKKKARKAEPPPRRGHALPLAPAPGPPRAATFPFSSSDLRRGAAQKPGLN